LADVKEYAELFKVIYGEMQVESNEEREGIIIFSLSPGELQRIDFDLLVYKCRLLGYLPFTVEEDPDRLFVIKLDKPKNYGPILRFVLFFITLASILYAGFEYSSLYRATTFLGTLITDILTFFLPMLGFLAFRELGRYFARSSSGMKYSFPVLIPDPLFFGTAGSISTSDEVYRDRKAMILCGGAPILFGFLFSVFIIVIGGLINVSYSPPGPVGSMPYTAVGFPLSFYYFFSFAIPFNGFINPMVFVGWIGLLVSALNFAPLGYLDGGLFWKGIIGKNFRYVSYASAVALTALGLVYPEIIVIPVFSIFLGLNGAEPLKGGIFFPHYVSAILVVIAVIFLVSMIPIHHIPSQIKMDVQVSTGTQVVAVTSGNVTNNTYNNLSVGIYNAGTVPVSPSFSISPQLQLYIPNPPQNIMPGSGANITLSMNTSGLSPGMYNFSLVIYTGTYSTSAPITLLVVRESGQLLFNGRNPYYPTPSKPGIPLKLSLFDDTNRTINVSLYVITDQPTAFTMTINASQFYRQSSNVPGSPISFNLFQITPYAFTTIQFVAEESPGQAEIVAMTSGYVAAICYADYQ
jgi:hypothetical protein